MEASLDLGEGRTGKVKRLSKELRQIYTIQNFLSAEEIKHLRGSVPAPQYSWLRLTFGTGEAISVGSVSGKLRTDVIARMAHVLQVPTTHVEFGRAMHYRAGQGTHAHHDGSTLIPRLSTLLVYLTTLPPERGGATVFPQLTPPLSIQPEAGTALLWTNQKHLTSDPLDPDILATHLGSEVLASTEEAEPKIVLTCWSRPAQCNSYSY